ncbi:hypothetical protein HW260_01060 [Helicobacter cinaedi]|uniref:Uncharacterized protein n=2 Tax=Helicobacter TaxID=209 RepID=A0AAI8MPJ4_9HELI|nr:hypothetical protein [Helicobacter cinaedi]EFR45726.1 hypothetical protein HCCG_00272 [Helicobacter cinaedi CCUG 18818 = ATCC BAA-847]QOQ90987.1 hypothetical protein HW260_01060 [Helicobacter cinaedi]BAM33094.1 hypothetical protein HCBAA847_1874 [Helicobacter cinaedi CCUG 18818 = ATCC BAA-847]
MALTGIVELLKILQEIFRLSDDKYNLLLKDKAVFDRLSPLTKQKELDIKQLEKTIQEWDLQIYEYVDRDNFNKVFINEFEKNFNRMNLENPFK